MEDGRGSSIWENGVLQNGDLWIPSTPHKPVLQSPTNAPSEIRQNQIGQENWSNFVNTYGNILQNKQLHNFDLNTSEGPSFWEQNNEGVPPIENNSSWQHDLPQTGILGMNGKVQSSHDVTPIEACNMFPLNSGVNILELNNQNVSLLHKLGSLNRNAGRNGTYSQNLGEVVTSQEFNSFADLMSIANAKHSPPANESLYRSTFRDDMPTITRPVSQAGSNNPHASVRLRPQQNHILHGSNHVAYATVGAGFPQTHATVGAGFPQSHVHYEYHDGGCYNRQEILNSRPLVDKYASNMTPRSEGKEFSSNLRSLPLGPVTPDQQKQFMTYRISQVPHLLVENASTPKKYVQGKAALSSDAEIVEKEHGDSLAKSMGTSTAAIATATQEMGCSDGVNAGFDLNKTPQQKNPRRKHRPKVVVEGKPKRSPKPPSTKSCGPDGNIPAKRKYTRKNDSKNSAPPVTDRVEVIEVSDTGPATKSCKRKLNFEETVADNRAEKEGQGSRHDHQEQNNELHKLRMESSGVSTSAANTYERERQQMPAASNFVQSVDTVLPQESTPPESVALTPTSRDHSLNMIARSLNMRNARIHQSELKSIHNQVHHHSNPVFESHPFEQNLGFRAQSSVQTMPQVVEDLVDVTDKQGVKRAYIPTVTGSIQNVTFMGSQIRSRGIPGLETCTKNSIGDQFNETSSSMHSGSMTAEEILQQIERGRNRSLLAQISTGTHYINSRNSDFGPKVMNVNPNDNSSNFIRDRYINYPDMSHIFRQQHALSQRHLHSESMLPETPQKFADTKITKSTSSVINRKESSSDIDPQPIPRNGNVKSPLHFVFKKRTPYEKEPVVQQHLQQEPENKKTYGKSSKKFTVNSVDDIINGMKHLRITSSGKELVPYKGNGAVVPYNLVKKRKPRPRVDLDPETNRLWNLLMGGESAEAMDTNKETWWEEERKVFRGRVDSFIAKMHLVQGDRRFSKWKGSVVDSVIGVFLTQNVSDHLSSSAFMSLAARFPSKSANAENGASPTKVRNQDVRITYPDGTTFHQKMAMELVTGKNQVIECETSTHTADNVMPEKKTFLVNDNYIRRTEEDMISSQSSSESFVLQASEDVRSSSGSNSDAECGWNVSKNLGHQSVSRQAEGIASLHQNKSQLRENLCTNKMHSIEHQQFEKPAYRQIPECAGISKVQHHQSSDLPFPSSWTNMLMGIGNWEAEDLSCLGRGSISTWTSKGTDAPHVDDYRGQSAESAFMVSKDGRSKAPSIEHPVLNTGLELQNDSLDESINTNCQHSIKHMSEKPTDNSKCTEVQTEMGQGQSPKKLPSKICVTTSPARKRKAEKEKAEPFNWDTLRKHVQSKAGEKERNREAMDSLDYEAMRTADVREISDAIKERGMNHILAERMKNFLNRLVEDHERIDLEWLRHVEPDRAKDYLLSIRGLGLKSVECIRLLTLHHLAFPVDTNVGRIAVRLGWVPLQPLPESLQLHLLELYPILETIQKYLWPRLCKLDQETLYELHYQMITFGKVFCTKRDPNCNACPLRAECRHFASAFASARLALPGPQERHIVSSAAPKSANDNYNETIKPMPLPALEHTMEREVRSSRDCEPLIEEPTTPELSVEEERDIEDAFYDDKEEIPVIKLNIEELATNIQSFIQEQIEIGEGDMSKALVALNPAFASLPAPKLKHVSRLRTEHRVYELPDSHPLLERMDRREPDDPSPYLLAIWTPGETADSVQPPESKCSSAGGCGLCNNEACFSCNSTREAQSQTVRGTILIPVRTAMRGSFPLNGTYFQVNEVFADHESSLNPIDVPRNILWNLPKRTVFFGTSVSSIFKGLSTEDIQFCSWKGLVCVRGFDQKSRAPRPLTARLHFPASRMMAKKNEEKS